MIPLLVTGGAPYEIGHDIGRAVRGRHLRHRGLGQPLGPAPRRQPLPGPRQSLHQPGPAPPRRRRGPAQLPAAPGPGRAAGRGGLGHARRPGGPAHPRRPQQLPEGGLQAPRAGQRTRLRHDRQRGDRRHRPRPVGLRRQPMPRRMARDPPMIDPDPGGRIRAARRRFLPPVEMTREGGMTRENSDSTHQPFSRSLSATSPSVGAYTRAGMISRALKFQPSTWAA